MWKRKRRNLLSSSIIGFESANRQHVGDGGIDIDGVLNTELVSINLKVQVKRISSSIGNNRILQIRGALDTDAHGVIICTSTFTRSLLQKENAGLLSSAANGTGNNNGSSARR